MSRTKEVLITFESPVDDFVEDSDGNIVVPGGNQILSQICELLKQEGYQTTGAEKYESYGWICHVTQNKQIVDFIISGGGGTYFLNIVDTANIVTVWTGYRDYCDIPALARFALELINRNQLGTNAVMEKVNH